MVTLVDALIVIILGLGAVWGFKKGVIRSATEFFGLIIVLVLAYSMKNFISEFLYTNLPFFTFSGVYEGVTVLNILIYEAIAYLLIFAVLMVAFRVVVAITGIIELILKFTIVLGIPSKLLGMGFGFLIAALLLFVGLFSYNQFTLGNNSLDNTFFGDIILNDTPILSNTVLKAYNSVEDVIKDIQDPSEVTDKDAYNKELFELMLDKQIISVDSARKLLEKDKLDVDNADEIISKYEEK